MAESLSVLTLGQKRECNAVKDIRKYKTVGEYTVNSIRYTVGEGC